MLINLLLSKSLGIRNTLAVFLFSFLKPLYFILKFRKPAWSTNMEDLAQMPVGSLGNDMAIYLQENDFTLIQKVESHDVFHVLLGFGSNMHGETCLQIALLGNGKHSLAVLITACISGMMYPEYWEDFRDTFYKWKSYAPFYQLNFEDLLMENTASLRASMLKPT